jgi:hypothetical protein
MASYWLQWAIVIAPLNFGSGPKSKPLAGRKSVAGKSMPFSGATITTRGTRD